MERTLRFRITSAYSDWNPGSIRARTASNSFRRIRRKARRSCARREAARAAQAEVLLGHLRRGRLDARAHARDRARYPRDGHAAAPHISCVASTRGSIREVLAALQGPRHPAHRGAARRPAVGSRRGRRIPLCERARRIHPRRDSATVSRSKSPAYPEYHPQARQRAGRTRSSSSARSTPAPSRRSRSISTTPMRTSSSSTQCEAMGIDDADRAGHHADRQFFAARALLRRVRRRDSALDAHESSKGYRRRHGVDPGVRARCGDRAVRRRLLATRRAGSALLYAEPGRAHDHDLAAARAVSAAGAGHAIVKFLRAAGRRHHRSLCAGPRQAMKRASWNGVA